MRSSHLLAGLVPALVTACKPRTITTTFTVTATASAPMEYSATISPSSASLSSASPSSASFSAAELLCRGVDWSSVLVEERDNNARYKNANGVELPLEDILIEAGVNMVHQRVWAVDGDYGIDYNLRLARRAAAAGLKFGLNLHYSETWTNPGLQDIPTGWPVEIDALEKKVYDYTLDICETFAAGGLYPEIISIGNEINAGLLWPTGKYDQPESLPPSARRCQRHPRVFFGHHYKDPDPSHARRRDSENQHWFYDMVLGTGFLAADDWDVIAVSFYPFWGADATMANLASTLTSLSEQYNEEVQVVETNWPTECSNPDYPFPPDQLSIPFSPEGQTQYISLLADTFKTVPRATGLNYWEASWINNAVLGSSCERNVLFAEDGTALSSLSVFSSI